MDYYRLLTDDEIITLENNGCTAENWTNVNVAEDFRAENIRNVRFFGEVNLGVFEKQIEVSQGFFIRSGIRNATLRNVTIGDNCLIENIGNFINNYTIGDDCLISNVQTIETTEGATFGEGNNISVMNEAGNGNVILYYGLTSNIAALMINRHADKQFTESITKLIKENIALRTYDNGVIGDGVKIINTTEISNTNISTNCEVNGACRLSDCTLATGLDDSVYIGSGVICDNSIIADGSVVKDNSILSNCYVGEACLITNGFSAESSLFFANSHMSNGEACAAFCGPFSASHHKSSLLIGCMVSFYNAGSATNFSNHAYKMGPVHHGTLRRGSKTASGSHILLPASIGAFSVCIGKITTHPDTTALPFSYIIADGKDTTIVPARNIISIGLYRDIRKWPRRDMRTRSGKRSVVNYDWLGPCTINAVVKGICTLKELREQNDVDTEVYSYGGCRISRKNLMKGIELYDMIMKMFIGEQLEKAENINPQQTYSITKWHDTGGCMLSFGEEEYLISRIKDGQIKNIMSITESLKISNELYKDRMLPYALSLIKNYLGINQLTDDVISDIIKDGNNARKTWIECLKNDALKEYNMGDVEKHVLDNIIKQLEEEDKEQ